MPQGNGEKIYIIDDDRDIVFAVQTMLQLSGYQIETSLNGDILERLLVEPARSAPAIILVDMLLSGKNGCDLIIALRQCTHTRHIPVIMLSAYPYGKQRALNAGADAFLSKPFQMRELLACIKRLLSSQAREAT
ncbi:two-component system alkaline phosphatase synthesis response regulator PhoP/two-component system response regulator CpxR [Thermosporothrix hazakensis]|jgi:DNA-binding response OmpR family regulator|uniref:Two-component system alkaline phosphatase synthesis response regulator PhoP/two-component system response regulator CpxR n=2 Tax=Thermosporothrix TaxID=768650 RepID=A0A326U187_THEHA|nr:response regulator [Thermosporothrix hazakensis]PZW24652.1 two-component system alkaline phosphatase synthesis response regulator PhoP/two-component system response regulator CpxR [Thermosporothrix hazakensis]BBH90364.1 hypothetical protein KTC_51150 [Thermosporothrix sp. COM3]GCE48400.1 hypothetical protein KTH_32690 [Thermosporothrix hazakensis]